LLFACQGNSSKEAPVATPISAEQLSQVCSGSWRLRDFEQGGETIELLAGSKLTFQCSTDGKVAGSSGVNRFFGSFTLNDLGQLEWPRQGFGATRMAGPEALMQQERRYLAALQQTSQMRMDGLDLVLGNDVKTLSLRFVANSD
jgi:heat shock protein HslJ